MSPVRRVHHHLGARSGDLVGHVEVSVGHQPGPLPDQHVAHPLVPAVAQVQHHVLGQRPDAVGLGGRLGERAHRAHLVGVQRPDHLDGRPVPQLGGAHDGTLEVGATSAMGLHFGQIADPGLPSTRRQG